MININILIIQHNTFCSSGCSYCFLNERNKDQKTKITKYDIKNLMSIIHTDKLTISGGDTFINPSTFFFFFEEIIKYNIIKVGIPIELKNIERDKKHLLKVIELCKKYNIKNLDATISVHKLTDCKSVRKNVKILQELEKISNGIFTYTYLKIVDKHFIQAEENEYRKLANFSKIIGKHFLRFSVDYKMVTYKLSKNDITRSLNLLVDICMWG